MTISGLEEGDSKRRRGRRGRKRQAQKEERGVGGAGCRKRDLEEGRRNMGINY